jgi:hypothetical protein
MQVNSSKFDQFILRNWVCKEMGASKVHKNSIPRHLKSEEDMRTFLKELISSSTPLRSMKMVVLGHGHIGKTTLLTSMHNILHPSNQQVREGKRGERASCFFFFSLFFFPPFLLFFFTSQFCNYIYCAGSIRNCQYCWN